MGFKNMVISDRLCDECLLAFQAASLTTIVSENRTLCPSCYDRQKRHQMDKAESMKTVEEIPRWDLIPWKAVEMVAAVCQEGEEKHKNSCVNGSTLPPLTITQEWIRKRFANALNHWFRWVDGDRSEYHLAKTAWFFLIVCQAERLGLIREDRILDRTKEVKDKV